MKDYDLVAFYLLTGLSGVAQVFRNVTPAYLLSILVALAATNWAVVDARTREVRFPVIFRVIYLLFWPLASLVYLIGTRRLRGLYLWVLNAVVVFVVMMATFTPTFVLLYLMGWTDMIDPYLLE